MGVWGASSMVSSAHASASAMASARRFSPLVAHTTTTTTDHRSDQQATTFRKDPLLPHREPEYPVGWSCSRPGCRSLPRRPPRVCPLIIPLRRCVFIGFDSDDGIVVVSSSVLVIYEPAPAQTSAPPTRIKNQVTTTTTRTHRYSLVAAG